MKKKLSFVILLLSLLPLFCAPSFSQETEMISPYVTFQYFKISDDQRILQTTLTYSKNRMELPLPGMEISFYSGDGNMELLSSIITDDKGVARFELANDIKLNTDSEGKWAFISEFKGNDSIEAGTSELFIKDVFLDVELTEVDSVKTISVSAFIDDGGTETAVPEEVVKIYVPTMFAPLLIGEITLDETGSGTLEFPGDLPGDQEGNLTIISKFEENETFGNVERRTDIKWGTPKMASGSVTHRALWTKTAPRWMIYTLSVLLAGVWGHYLYAIISLIRIKNDAKAEARKEYKS